MASWRLGDRSAGQALRDAMAASALTIRQYGPPRVDTDLRAEHRLLSSSIDVVALDDARSLPNGVLL